MLLENKWDTFLLRSWSVIGKFKHVLNKIIVSWSVNGKLFKHVMIPWCDNEKLAKHV